MSFSTSTSPPDISCTNSTLEPDEDEEEYHFDYMWILIGAMVCFAYLVAAVVLITPIFKRKKEPMRKRYTTPLAVKNSHTDMPDEQQV